MELGGNGHRVQFEEDYGKPRSMYSTVTYLRTEDERYLSEVEAFSSLTFHLPSCTKPIIIGAGHGAVWRPASGLAHFDKRVHSSTATITIGRAQFVLPRMGGPD